jgi:CheY-like chemotaxis protein
MLEVEVTDTGVGIEPHMIDRVFDAFAQEEHDRGHRFGGIGLGLAISRQLVELQHGQIRAESAGRGRGATFRIELPLASVDVPSVTPALVSPSAPSLPARRILLVEDHDDTRTTLMQLLGRRGHSVTGAATVNAARTLAADGAYDLVISDLGLPDGDGHQLMSELHRAYGLTGIALSGYGMDDDIARSHASGFFMHLTKPIDIKVLSAAIAGAPAVGSIAPNGASAVESITR